MRELPLRNKKAKKKIEEDSARREESKALLRVPEGSPAFRAGYRECLELFSLHRPNRRGVGRILEEHAGMLAGAGEQGREQQAQHEGFRQALKDLRRNRLVR